MYSGRKLTSIMKESPACIFKSLAPKMEAASCPKYA